jgi:hypothetical protein
MGCTLGEFTVWDHRQELIGPAVRQVHGTGVGSTSAGSAGLLQSPHSKGVLLTACMRLL